ncbi:hypothetical protein CMT52_19135 [Elizabethkingia anophelis]|uniref:DUF3823 domain-containing protein n=1 Tax=Elizabethkingia anophelis TaxID=1117645 RepID=UPI00293C4AF6|nr:hypothetical protein [Elizabethkingia anophelis]MDV4026447.1 hypothetical protein [Elizabethkingia anophelis]
MKNSNFKIFTTFFLALLLSSCSNGGDNYEAPSVSFTGRIMNKSTGQPVPGQEPNGARIRMFEGGKYKAKVPVDFWVMQDGTFANKTLFSGTYKVIAEGPFQKTDTLSLNLGGSSTYDFNVVPFLDLTIEIVEKKTSSIVVKYKINQSEEKRKILRRAVLVSNRPYVDATNYINTSPFINTTNVLDIELVGKEFTTEITGLTKGVQYYLRSASRCDNPSSYYNYSEIIPFTL